jgi:hypothetical protein
MAISSLLCYSLLILYPICGFFIGYWLYKDAEARGDRNYLAWFFVGFFFTVGALILYLIDREDKPKMAPPQGYGAPPPPYQPQQYAPQQGQPGMYPPQPLGQPPQYAPPQYGQQPYPQPHTGPPQYATQRQAPQRYYEQPVQQQPPMPQPHSEGPLEVKEPEMPKEYPALDDE